MLNFLTRIKTAFDNRRYLFSTIKTLMGEEAKKQPFSYNAAVRSYSSWIYAAANLNAIAVASQPLRLYVRGGSRRKLLKTRRVSSRTRSYLTGEGQHLPSRTVSTKAMDYGDDFEVVTDSHPVLDLLKKVNPYQNGYDATILRILYTELTGNAYLHPVIDRSLGIPVELWTMPSQMVEIVPGTERLIDGYLYGASREQRRFFEADEVIHFKRPNPVDIYYGMGKVEAAWDAAQMNYAVHEMDLHFFVNKARPDWLMTVKSAVDPSELDRLEAQIDEKLRGGKRNGRFLTVSADIDVKPLSFQPKDLAGRDSIVEEIAAVFGVPVSMLKANDPNLASATVGFASWKANTVLPLLRMDEEMLNQSLLPLFGIEDDAFLAYDNPVMSDERFEFDKARASVAAGIMTVNEARVAQGLDRFDDPAADILLFNNQPLGAPPPTAGPIGPMGLSADGLGGEPDAGDTFPGQDAALTLGAAGDWEQKATDDCVSAKIPKLIAEGYPQDQAIAIAISMCEREKSLHTKDCGTGAGGFKPGNTCGDEEGGDDGDAPSGPKKLSPIKTDAGHEVDQEEIEDETVSPTAFMKDAMIDEDTITNFNTPAMDKAVAASLDAIEEVKFPMKAYTDNQLFAYFTGQADMVDVEAMKGIVGTASKYGMMSAQESIDEVQRQMKPVWKDLRKQIAAGKITKNQASEMANQAADEIRARVNDERDASARTAAAKMKAELEQVAATTPIVGKVRLMRGLNLSGKQIEAIIKSGFVSHEGTNSWTTSRDVARRFHGDDALLVVREPKVGIANVNSRYNESEVIRPPSRMKIVRVIRARSETKGRGVIIEVEEDDAYK